MVTFTVNGETREFAGDPTTPVLWYLRDELNLTGPKFGCGMAQCGACTVHIDGMAQRSCVLPLSAVAGKAITTIEGLSADGDHPVQQAWVEHKVPQCGFCQCGQMMQAASLLTQIPVTKKLFKICRAIFAVVVPTPVYIKPLNRRQSR